MKLLQEPPENRWSCMAYCLAMITGYPLKAVTDAIGHDGSKILWPELPEPQNRRGFTHDEICLAALKFGLTPIMFVNTNQVAPTDTSKISVFHAGIDWMQCPVPVIFTNNQIDAGDSKAHARVCVRGLIFDSARAHMYEAKPEDLMNLLLPIVIIRGSADSMHFRTWLTLTKPRTTVII